MGPLPFTLMTDNRAVVHSMSQPVVTGQHVRWLQTLAEYNFHIKHVPGKLNIAADALSRQPVPTFVPTEGVRHQVHKASTMASMRAVQLAAVVTRKAAEATASAMAETSRQTPAPLGTPGPPQVQPPLDPVCWHRRRELLLFGTSLI
jgi:hypothetical protein